MGLQLRLKRAMESGSNDKPWDLDWKSELNRHRDEKGRENFSRPGDIMRLSRESCWAGPFAR